MIKAIIFDLQGTLVENGVYPSPLKQAHYAFRFNGSYHEFVPAFEHVFMTQSYPSLREAFITTASELHINLPDFVVERLVGMWNKNRLFAKIIPDVIETLEELKKNYKLILIANIDCFSKDIIEKFDLTKYFDIISISCDNGILKDDPECFLAPLRELNIAPEDAIVVGDSIDSDMVYAKNAGIISVLYDRDDRRDYVRKIPTLADIKNYL